MATQLVIVLRPESHAVGRLMSQCRYLSRLSEVDGVEQILIRNLPSGTKAALKARAQQNRRSVEAEARDILTMALERSPLMLVDLLGMDDGADIDFEPEPLGLSPRTAEL